MVLRGILIFMRLSIPLLCNYIDFEININDTLIFLLSPFHLYSQFSFLFLSVFCRLFSRLYYRIFLNTKIRRYVSD